MVNKWLVHSPTAFTTQSILYQCPLSNFISSVSHTSFLSISLKPLQDWLVLPYCWQSCWWYSRPAQFERNGRFERIVPFLVDLPVEHGYVRGIMPCSNGQSTKSGTICLDLPFLSYWAGLLYQQHYCQQGKTNLSPQNFSYSLFSLQLSSLTTELIRSHMIIHGSI